MASFIQDFRKLLQNTHQQRLSAFRQGVMNGGMVGAVVGYIVGKNLGFYLQWLTTGVGAFIGGLWNGHHSREAVIVQHLKTHENSYDPRLVALIRDKQTPHFTAAEEESIAREASRPDPAGGDFNYQFQLFQTISPSIGKRMRELREQPEPVNRKHGDAQQLNFRRN